jgi:hypothetical protein
MCAKTIFSYPIMWHNDFISCFLILHSPDVIYIQMACTMTKQLSLPSPICFDNENQSDSDNDSDTDIYDESDFVEQQLIRSRHFAQMREFSGMSRLNMHEIFC